jgi:hypothetical protein
MIGGCINWALSLLAMYTPYHQQLLLLALAVLLGYIIPGHMLKANFRKNG